MTIVKPPVSGSFTSTGASDGVRVSGKCNVTLSFSGAGVVALERSFDGVIWAVVSKNNVPEKAEFTQDINTVVEEPELGVFYRWNCVSYSSGSIAYRIGRSELGHFN